MDKPNTELLQNQINALVDGQLSRQEYAKAMTRLAEDPVALETLRVWQTQREALRALHQPMLEEAIPETLLAATRQGQQSLQQRDQWRRWGGMAASVMLAFGVGWTGRPWRSVRNCRHRHSCSRRQWHTPCFRLKSAIRWK
jgi:anti-sigma factor RsiW